MEIKESIVRKNVIFGTLLIVLLACTQASGMVTFGGILRTNDFGISVDSVEWVLFSSPFPIKGITEGWGGDPGTVDTFLFQPLEEWPSRVTLFYSLMTGGGGQYGITPINPDTWYDLQFGQVYDVPQVLFSESLVGLQSQEKIELTAPFAAAPNPFISRTIINYNLSGNREVRIELFDESGRPVRTLVQKSLPGGRYSFVWDGEDNKGCPVGPGVYFARLSINNNRKFLKLIRIRS